MTCLITVETKRHQQNRQESQSLIIDNKTLCDKKKLKLSNYGMVVSKLELYDRPNKNDIGIE